MNIQGHVKRLEARYVTAKISPLATVKADEARLPQKMRPIYSSISLSPDYNQVGDERSICSSSTWMFGSWVFARWLPDQLMFGLHRVHCVEEAAAFFSENTYSLLVSPLLFVSALH